MRHPLRTHSVRTLASLALFSVLFALGCGSGRYVQRGISAYERQDYVAAMHQWENLSGDEGELNHKGLVRYLVYRGLTHYRFGQRAEALYFLSRGRAGYAKGDPGWLKPEAVTEMDRALQELSANPPPSSVHVVVVPSP